VVRHDHVEDSLAMVVGQEDPQGEPKFERSRRQEGKIVQQPHALCQDHVADTLEQVGVELNINLALGLRVDARGGRAGESFGTDVTKGSQLSENLETEVSAGYI